MRGASALVLVAVASCSGSPTPAGDLVPRVLEDVDFRTGRAPLSVELTTLVSGGDPPVSIEWDFDDGTTATGDTGQ